MSHQSSPYFQEDQILMRLASLRTALAVMAPAAVTMPYKGSPIEIFNRYIDFGVACYAAKLEELCSGALGEFSAARYANMAVISRAIVENAAVLHHLVQDECFSDLRSCARTQPHLSEAVKRACDRLYKFTHGNNFQWDALIQGNREQFMGEARAAHHTTSQVRVGRDAMKALNKAYPASRPLYNLLTELSHPNLGSNFLVLTTKNGRTAACVGRRSEGQRQMALNPLAGVEELLRKHALPDLSALKGLKFF